MADATKYTSYGTTAAEIEKLVSLPIGVDDEIDMADERIIASNDLGDKEQWTAGVLYNEIASVTPPPGKELDFLDALAEVAAVIARVRPGEVAKSVPPRKGLTGRDLDNPSVAERWALVQRAVRMSRAIDATSLYHFVLGISEDGLTLKKEMNTHLKADWVWKLADSIVKPARGPFHNERRGGDVPTTDQMYFVFFTKK